MPSEPRLTGREQRRINQARTWRDRAIDQLRAVTDQQLADLTVRARYTALPDGHKTRTMSDGTPHTTSPLTPVEAAADTRGFPGTDGVPPLPPDRTGMLIAALFAALEDAADACGHVATIQVDIAHRYSTREYRTGGACACCGRLVAGTEDDRLRAGYCQACHRAWARAGRPGNRARFESQRRAELAARDDEAG